jgi:ATP-dependent Lon protease
MKPSLAMTGELTLKGKVMPIGGLKEKVLAARRNKIKEIIIPQFNKRDLDKLDETVTKGITFHLVGTIDEVLKIAFPDDAKRKSVHKPAQVESSPGEQVAAISAAVAEAVKDVVGGH